MLALPALRAMHCRAWQNAPKPSYTPHVDCGDHVIILNADKVKFTGRKMGNKKYYKHTGYAGGIKETTPAKILEGKFPERVVEKAVERMIPRGPLGLGRLAGPRRAPGAAHARAAARARRARRGGGGRGGAQPQP